jgi:hypothetical protein
MPDDEERKKTPHAEIRRLTENGLTIVPASTMNIVKSRIDTDNILDLAVHLQLQRVHRGIEMNLLSCVSSRILRGKMMYTLFKKCIKTIWESRLPRLPGRVRSVGLPTSTTTR